MALNGKATPTEAALSAAVAPGSTGHVAAHNELHDLLNKLTAWAPEVEKALAAIIPGLSATDLRSIDAVLRWSGTGTQPLRATVTTDTLRRVRWVQPTQPPLTTGYAIDGLDVWEKSGP